MNERLRCPHCHHWTDALLVWAAGDCCPNCNSAMSVPPRDHERGGSEPHHADAPLGMSGSASPLGMSGSALDASEPGLAAPGSTLDAADSEIGSFGGALGVV